MGASCGSMVGASGAAHAIHSGVNRSCTLLDAPRKNWELKAATGRWQAVNICLEEFQTSCQHFEATDCLDDIFTPIFAFVRDAFCRYVRRIYMDLVLCVVHTWQVNGHVNEIKLSERGPFTVEQKPSILHNVMCQPSFGSGLRCSIYNRIEPTY